MSHLRWLGRLAVGGVTLLLIVGLASPAAAVIMWSTGNNGTTLVQIETTTGLGTVVGPMGVTDAFGLAIGPGGTLYTVANSYSASGRLASVNRTTGAATVFGAAVGVPDMMVLEFASDGTMYTASWATNALYQMDPLTGVPTFIGNLGFGNIMDLAFDTTGQLWATNMGGLYSINTSSGAGTFVTGISGTDGCNMGIAFDGANNLYGTSWCSGNSPLWQFDTGTGAATVVGLTGVASLHGGDIEAEAVPEPASLLLLGAGLAGLAGFRRRRT